MFHGTQQEGQSQTASDGASSGAGLGRRRECFAAYRPPPSVAASQRYRRLSGIEAGLGGEIRRDSRAEMLHCATSVQFCCSKIKQASWGLPRAFDPQLALFTRKSSLLSRREAVFSVPVGGEFASSSPTLASRTFLYTPLRMPAPVKLPLLCTPRRLEKEPPGILWGGDCSAFAEAATTVSKQCANDRLRGKSDGWRARDHALARRSSNWISWSRR